MTTRIRIDLKTGAEISETISAAEMTAREAAPEAARAALARAITAEQDRRATAARYVIPVDAETTLTQPLGPSTRDRLAQFALADLKGRAPASVLIQTDQASILLSADHVRLLDEAAEAYIGALVPASAALHDLLAGTADADLDAFDPSADAHWPDLDLTIDLTAAPAQTKMAELEARIAALESA